MEVSDQPRKYTVIHDDYAVLLAKKEEEAAHSVSDSELYDKGNLLPEFKVFSSRLSRKLGAHNKQKKRKKKDYFSQPRTIFTRSQQLV